MPQLPVGASWLNTDRPLRREDFAGCVTVLDFWTYCCVNCMHVLPVLARIEERFAGQPVCVVGIHSAKFLSEKDPANIAKAMQRHDVRHPVIVDSQHMVWEEFSVRAWPTLVIVDSAGYVRETLAGEIEEGELAHKLRRYLDEGAREGTLADTAPDFGDIAIEAGDQLRFPGKLLCAGGRVFIADSGHHRIVVCDEGGRVERVVGTGGAGQADGPLAEASFFEPQGMELVGDTLFVADRGNHLIRAIDLEDGEVRTVAGTGRKGTKLAGLDPHQPLTIPLRSPWDLSSVGPNLIVAMAGSHQLWVFQPDRGVIGPWAGNGAEGHVDGGLGDASFAQPSGLARAGRLLFVADSEVSSVRAVDLHDLQVQTVVGQDLFDFGDRDGQFDRVLLQHPLDVAVAGNKVYVADSYNQKVREIDLGEQLSRTVLGDGDSAQLHEPGGLELLGDKLLIADTNNHRLRLGDPATGVLADWPLEDPDGLL